MVIFNGNYNNIKIFLPNLDIDFTVFSTVETNAETSNLI